MSVNKYRPHLFVLPEDDANRQLANGFQLDPLLNNTRQMQILEVAGGWREVLARFGEDHIAEMNGNPGRFMVLLIDCDGDDERLIEAKAGIPENLRERVFILGAREEPESLRQELGMTYEEIGLALAKDCRDNTNGISTHEHLSHNLAELERLRTLVRPIFFPAA